MHSLLTVKDKSLKEWMNSENKSKFKLKKNAGRIKESLKYHSKYDFSQEMYQIYSQSICRVQLKYFFKLLQNPTGDQPKNIEEIVLKMVRHYIRNPKSIIVAVSKATDDSANSESLKLARQVDRDGSRTLSVITQVDLVDQGVNVLR